MCFLWFHDYKPIKVKHPTIIGYDHYYLSTDKPVKGSLIIYKCKNCKAKYSQSIKGKWEIFEEELAQVEEI